MLTLFQSNHFEVLLESMIKTESIARIDYPFLPLEIIVPNIAIAQQIELDWAKHQGICANLKFFYLLEWIWQQICKVIVVPDLLSLTPDAVSWKLYKLFIDTSLPPLIFLPPDGRLNKYLSKANDIQRFQLAHRIAYIFHYYQIYRTDWLDTWINNHSIFDVISLQKTIPSNIHRDDEQWQAILWREIAVNSDISVKKNF